MKVIVVANQKGGVGKSICSYNHVCYYSEKPSRVVLLETDEQGNSSSSLANYILPGLDSSFLFKNNPIEFPEITQPITVLQGNKALRDIEKMNDTEILNNLKSRLSEMSHLFDYCIIDTPGANSKVANACIIASHFVYVPIIVDTYSVDVAKDILKRIILIQKHFNPALVNLGLLPNLLEATSPTQKADLEELIKEYNHYLIKAKISKSTAFRDAAGKGIPVWKLKKTSGRLAGKEIRAVFDKLAEVIGN